jgi:hypothetical protein
MFGRLGDLVGGSVRRLRNCRLKPFSERQLSPKRHARLIRLAVAALAILFAASFLGSTIARAFSAVNNRRVWREAKATAGSPLSELQNEDESKAEVRLTGGNAVNTPSAPVAAANDVALPAKEVTANIARPPLGTPLPQHAEKDGGDFENYVSTGSVIVVVGALLFFLARQISRKLFWRDRGFN